MWAGRVVLALFVLINGGFAATVHLYSQQETAARLAQIDARREAAIAAATQAESARAAAAAAAFEERRAREQEERRAAALAALPGDPAKGRMTYMTCVGCHGMKGEGMRAFKTPRLAGQHPWYLKSQLLKFREGMRGSHPQDLQGAQMAPMARLLATESIIDDVVAYIASISVDRPVDSDRGDADAGRELYAVCATCHGPQAEGLQAQKAPNLANQHPWYLEHQLLNFRQGRRGHDERDVEGRMMVPMARALPTEQAVYDVVSYIRRLGER